MHVSKATIAWLLAVSMAPMLCHAQDRGGTDAADTLGALKAYVAVCNNYKTLPLQVQLGVHSAADVGMTAADTADYTAAFYVLPHGMYIKMQDIEQVVNDSVAVMIDNGRKRMSLYGTKTPLLSQLTAYAGLLGQDSSLQKLAAKYKAQLQSGGTGDTGEVTLESRACLPGTAMPALSISVTYNRTSTEPSAVRLRKRQLILVDSVQYTKLLLMPEYANKLVKTVDGHFYVIKTQTVTYRYWMIGHTPGVQLPLETSDCVTKNASGAYLPAARYAGYTLRTNR